MADSPNVKVGVSVDNTNLFSGLQEATAGIKSFGKDIESNFKGLTSSITNMIAPLTAITGIVGGLEIGRASCRERVCQYV